MSSGVVRVGVGVIVVRDDGTILIGKRKNSFAPYYSIPGGCIEPGETFEQAAIREAEEETNLIICEPRVIAITNNLETYVESGKHFISVILVAHLFSGELANKEPDKCEGWYWVDPNNLPNPLFDACKKGVACYLQNRFY